MIKMFANHDLENNDCTPRQGDEAAIRKSELERLGRQRPEAFPTAISEILFCTSMLASMLMSVSTPNMMAISTCLCGLVC